MGRSSRTPTEEMQAFERRHAEFARELPRGLRPDYERMLRFAQSQPAAFNRAASMDPDRVILLLMLVDQAGRASNLEHQLDAVHQQLKEAQQELEEVRFQIGLPARRAAQPEWPEPCGVGQARITNPA